MYIKKTEEKDIPQLATLYIESRPHNAEQQAWRHSWAADRLEVMLRTPGSYGLCVYSNNRLVGCLVGRAIPYKGALEFDILELFTEPNHKQRPKQALLFALQKHLRERGYRKCTLRTLHDSTETQFYTEQGFCPEKGVVFLSHELSTPA
jgi:ribosomal protein S18 acetylase RimI-like enzyme